MDAERSAEEKSFRNGDMKIDTPDADSTHYIDAGNADDIGETWF